MNPFIWLAVALGFLAVTDDEKAPPVKKKTVTELKDLPKGSTISIGEEGEIIKVKPPSEPAPPSPKPTTTPKPKPPPEIEVEEEEEEEEEDSLPEEIGDWMDVFDQGLPYLDWLYDQGESWLEDDAEYDDEYYEGDYYDDDYYYYDTDFGYEDDEAYWDEELSDELDEYLV